MVVKNNKTAIWRKPKSTKKILKIAVNGSKLIGKKCEKLLSLIIKLDK